jgi:acyl-CoA thioester hydrolase
MLPAHEIEVVPAFYDVDPMWVVWHGHYVRFMELARSALMTKVGYDYEQMVASGYAWPIVDLRLKYVKGAKLKQRLRVRVQVVEFEHRLKLSYLITDAATGERLTVASTIQVAVDVKTGEMQYVCPRVLWAALGVEP